MDTSKQVVKDTFETSSEKDNMELNELTLKYFELEATIHKMHCKKNDLEKEIMNEYNNKSKIYTLIQKKQKAQEDEIINNNLNAKII